MFEKMRVSVKLGFGFGLVILLLTAIVVTAIVNMAAMNHTTTEITDRFYANVALANDADKNAATTPNSYARNRRSGQEQRGLGQKAGKLLEEMVPNINKTSDLVQEITAASEEQSSGTGQINTAMNQLSQITQQSASSSEELASTAEEMSASAELLQQLVGFFNVGEAVMEKRTSTKVTAKKPVSPLAVRPVSVQNEGGFVKF